MVHTDRAMDNEIVRSRLVDVLLTGHDHDLAIGYDGKTVMVESNEEGNYVTAIDIAPCSVQRRGRATASLVVADLPRHDSATVARPTPRSLRLVKGYEAELSKELDVDVAPCWPRARQPLGLVRSQEAAIGNLIADAIRRRRRAPTSPSPMAAASAPTSSIRPATR